jgi:hypothetical protein
VIPSSTTITDEGRRTRRVLMWTTAAIVALNLVVWIAGSLGSGGAVSGPNGSSYVTTRSGTAALAGTLERLDQEVVRLRVPLHEADLTGEGTAILSEVGAGDYTAPELNALEDMVRSGGRLLVVGRADMVERFLADPPTWRSAGSEFALAPGGALPGVAGKVPLSGFGSLEPTDLDRPLLVGADGSVIALERPVGEGSFVWVADSFPFHNESLADREAATAAFALVDPYGPVYFDEYRHGFRDEGGLWDLIPAGWRTVLLLEGLVGVLALVAYGRRFGPPHDLHRRLPPGRDAYLESVAGILERSGGTAAALDTIRQEGRRLIGERADGPDIDAAARSAGLTPEQREALLGDDTSNDKLLAADRGLAALTREKR